MDLGTRMLLSLAALLALNTAMVRLEMLRDRSVLFWGVQGLNLCVAGFLFVKGMPGFHHIPVIAWVLGLWLVLRMALNQKWWLARQRDQDDDTERARRASAIRKALDE